MTACPPTPLHAQQAPQPSPTEAPYVLHLDTRMAQVPTLILSSNSRPVPLFDPKRIDITIDSGHRFHPTHVRFEGDDPITLAILLDVSSKKSDLLGLLSKTFSSWITSSLKPQDHVSIYALDCALLQTANYQPATPSLLQRDLDTAISSPLSHGKKARPACGYSIRLRGAIDVIMNKLAPLPGRHVLLVISGGYDGGSVQSWLDLEDAATGSATTIFGINSPATSFYSIGIPLDELARQSGGLVYRTSSTLLPQRLAQFITALRHREILEFPIPLDFPGNHILYVAIEHSDAQALPSGIPILPIPEAPPTIPITPQIAAPPQPDR